MNRAWLIRADARLTQAEAAIKGLEARIAELLARLEAAEAKAHVHPGRKASE